MEPVDLAFGGNGFSFESEEAAEKKPAGESPSTVRVLDSLDEMLKHVHTFGEDI
jgi:hypothetical protein